ERAAFVVVAGGCILLGWTELALFVWTTAAREVLAVMLLTLFSVSAFAFAWGWRIGLTLLPTLAVLPWLATSDHLVELHTAMAVGIVITLGVADLTARNLAHA